MTGLIDNQSKSIETIVLHYDGKKLKNHTFNSDKFIESITAFNCLIKSISNDMGLKENELKISVRPIVKGSLEIEFVVAVATFIGLNSASSIIGSIISTRLISLIKSKKDNKNDINLMGTKAIDSIDTKIAKNPDNHKYIEDMSKCLLNAAETL